MKITPIVPHPALQPIFKKYFAQQGRLDEAVVSALTAKGYGALMIPFGEPVCSHIFTPFGFDNGGAIDRPILCGNTNMSIEAAYNPGALNILFLIFQSTGVWHFARHNAAAFSNRFHFAEDLSPTIRIAEMQERLWGVYDPADVVRIVESYLLRDFLQYPPNWQADIGPIAAHIHRRQGDVGITELARKFRWSPRWLEKQFHQQIGMTPKLYARITRFQAVANRLLQQPDTGWITLVAEFGYTDQSHLIKDFLRFSGRLPGRFFHPDQQIDRSLLNGMH